MVSRGIAVLGLLGVIGFCVFGFLATFEPMDAGKQILWRIMYGGIGAASLMGIAAILFARSKH